MHDNRFDDAVNTVRRWSYEPNCRIPAQLVRVLACSNGDFNLPLERSGSLIITQGGNEVLAVAVKDNNDNVIAYDI